MLLLWIIFNGKVTVEILLFGIVICAVLQRFAKRSLSYDPQKTNMPKFPIGFAVKYYIILIWEIIKANIQVLRIVWSPNIEVQPQVVSFQTDLQETPSRVLLANSITLTPGTITIQLNEGEYVVHALDKAFTEDLAESVFVKQLREMEGKMHG